MPCSHVHRLLLCNWTPLVLWLIICLAPVASLDAAQTSSDFIPDDVWNERSEIRSDEKGDVVGAAGRMSLGLVVVLALMVGCLVLLKKFMQGKQRLLPSGKHLSVIETLPVGVKRSVLLLELGDQVLVVGQSEAGLQHLSTFGRAVLENHQRPKPPAKPEELVPDPEPATVPVAADADADASQRIQRFQDRLEALIKP